MAPVATFAAVPWSAPQPQGSRRDAQAAGLLYTTDARPGIRRQRRGRTFRYVNADGRPVRAAAELDRIRSLAIPPAWTDVWICPDPKGHLQATGRDARGRKQYRYHPRWRAVRDENKYDRLTSFAQVLPIVRRVTSAHLKRPGLPREKVLATVVQLLEKTLIRVGNGEYAKTNGSYGLTTLRDGHVRIRGERVRFTFRGKSGVEHDIDLNDRYLARIVRQCRDLPGYDLFQYVDQDGRPQVIGSQDVNAYLQTITGQDLTSKDFRTWAGTVLALRLLIEGGPCTSRRQVKRNIVQVVENVARRLGNTKAVCRKCYIHPAVFEAYTDGSMPVAGKRGAGASRVPAALSAEELALLKLLQRRSAPDLRKKAS